MRHIYYVLLVIILLLITGCFNERVNIIKVRHGFINLSDINFKNEQTIKLDGEWEFYWNKLLTSDDFVNINSNIQTLTLPGSWTKDINPTNQVSRFGFATLRLKFTIKSGSNIIYGLRIREICTAYNLFLNNNLILSSGTVGRNKSEYSPKWKNQVAIFNLSQPTNEFILQIANYDHIYSGVLYSLEFGRVEEIVKNQQYSRNLDMFLFGILIIMGLYHLGLFILRRKDLSTFYFGIFTLLIASRVLLTGERILIDNINFYDWQFFTKIEYLLSPLASMFFILYLEVLYPDVLKNIFTGIFKLISIIYALIVIITPESIFSEILNYYFIIVFLICSYIIYALINAMLKKRKDVLLVLISFFILFISIVNDVLFLNLVVYTGLSLPYGVFLFILSQSFLLSIRFSKAFNDIESLTVQLEEYNLRLEEKVAGRTKDLELANIQIERDKNLLKLRNIEMENQLEMAKKIQLKLIPQISPNKNISFLYKSMDKVGGDFFDIIQFKEPHLIGIFVSDVSGHGVPAALITSMLKTIISKNRHENK